MRRTRWAIGWVGLLVGAVAAMAQGPAGTLSATASPAVRDAVTVLDLWIREQRIHQRLPGLSLAVVDDQEVVWTAGYGFADVEREIPATPDTLYRLGSITKLFTATAILQLRDAGALDLDDPVRRHLPWFAVENPFPGSPEITVEHLLTHTSGLPRETTIPYWTTHEFPDLAALQETLPSLRLLTPPGQSYRYSNLGMALLGHVVEAASGKPYADYLREAIFAPLGMDDTTAAPGPEHHARRAVSYFRRMPDGSRRTFDYYDLEALAAAGNLVSSVRDLATFAKLQFRDGRAGGEQILDGYTLSEMQRVHVVAPSFSGGRGLGWGVRRDDDTTFVSHAGWVGGNRSHLLTVPAEEVAVVVITNADDADPGFFARRIYDFLAPLLAASPDEAAEEAGESPPADPRWQQYLGTYGDPWGWEYEVLVLGERLAMYEHEYPPADTPGASLTYLEAQDDGSFLLPDGEPVVFELGDDGRVERIQRRFEYLFPVDGR